MSAPLDVAHLLRVAMEARPLSGAVESGEATPRYRYALWRLVNPVPSPRWLAFVMINPSTGSFEKDDPTLESCLRFREALNFDGIVVCNLFALRSPKTAVLKTDHMPIGVLNDLWIDAVMALGAFHVAGWGRHGAINRRNRDVGDRLVERYDLHALRLLQDGEPEHPLYLSPKLKPVIFRSKKAA